MKFILLTEKSLEMKFVLKHHDFQMFGLKSNKYE